MAGGANPNMVMAPTTAAPTTGAVARYGAPAPTPLTPQQQVMQGAGQVDPYTRASAANLGALATYADPSQAAMNMMNPYQQAVVDKTLRDVGSSAMMGMNALDAQATQAGAFGGSRHGVAMAEAAKGFNQQALDKVGALNQQGYNQAMANAMNAASGLQSAGQQAFGMGQAVNQQQMQQGAMQQQMMQNLINQGKQNFQGFAQQPQNNLATMLQTITAQPAMAGQARSFQPGLFNYMQMFGGM